MEKYLKIASWGIIVLLGGSNPAGVLGQTKDSIYFANLVRHADLTECNHTPPNASFVVFLDHDTSRILLDTSPRWDPTNEHNLPGTGGRFGVELANYVNPSLQVGDSVFVQYTCTATGQSGILSDGVTRIPWFRFPLRLDLSAAIVPTTPQNIRLSVDSTTHVRNISWTPVTGMSYSVYRRPISDVLPDGRARMLYSKIAQGIAGGSLQDITGLPTEKYGYVVFAVSTLGVMSAHPDEVNELPVIPPGDDLTISYIARLPRKDYVWASSEPDRDGWPGDGSIVTWQAKVKNWSGRDLPAVPYVWYLDAVPVDSGTVQIPARDTALVNYQWQWTFTRHELTLVIDPRNVIPEEEEQNNQLSIYTNAISAGFYVEQSVYDYFHQYQKMLPNVHSNCWEDWAQRHVRRWNQMLANAIYPETPNGVIDRVRLDKITIVPDGALPLAGGLASNNPNMNDRTVDLQWGFSHDVLNGTFYANHTSVSDNNAFYFEGSLFHELGHARYLVDVYGFNIDEGSVSVAIQENGLPVAGSQYMPYAGGTSVYYTPIRGLMNSQYTYIDRYSASALNLIAGHRAVMGNYNAPDNIGVFMQDLPAQNRLKVKDASGAMIPNSTVWVYQATGRPGVWYGKYFDNAPDLQLMTDSNGQVLLGRCPFSPNGSIVHDYGLSQALAIIRVAQGSRVGYGFLESSSFNFEFWRGHTALGEYEISINMIGPTSVSQGPDATPAEYGIDQNYPNPFNSTTVIKFSVPSGQDLTSGVGWQMPRRESGQRIDSSSGQAGIKVQSNNSLGFGNGNPDFVSLKVYDLLGREVTTLVNEPQRPGVYQVRWNGRDSKGVEVASGIYFVRMKAGTFLSSKKMLLMR